MSSSSDALVRVGVIGTSGCKDNAKLVTAPLFGVMTTAICDITDKMILKPRNRVRLVSGGCSFSDDTVPALLGDEKSGFKYAELCLPCRFDTDKKQFFDTGHHGAHSWKTNPGQTLNMYHRKLHEAVFEPSKTEPSLDRLARVIVEKKASSNPCSDVILRTDGRSFEGRNRQIAADLDILIAFTWGKDSHGAPTDAGTRMTWNMCTNPKTFKILVNLTDLLRTKSFDESKFDVVPLIGSYRAFLSSRLMYADSGDEKESPIKKAKGTLRGPIQLYSRTFLMSPQKS